MEKNTEKQIKAEIKDGKLIIDGVHEFNLEGLKNLAESIEFPEAVEDLSNLSFSMARIALMVAETFDTDKHIDSQILMTALPESYILYSLKAISDSLKKM